MISNVNNRFVAVYDISESRHHLDSYSLSITHTQHIQGHCTVGPIFSSHFYHQVLR